MDVLSDGIFLVIALGIVGFFVATIIPALLWVKCQECGCRNLLDAAVCKRCGKALPEN